MKRLGKHSPMEYVVFAESLAATPVVRIMLGLAPLKTVRRAVRFALRSRRSLAPARRLPLQRVVRMTLRAARFSPFPATCLVKALVGEALLRRHGYDASLCVGVQRKQSGEFAAHAWVECQGDVVIGGPVSEVSRYTAFPSIEELLT